MAEEEEANAVNEDSISHEYVFSKAWKLGMSVGGPLLVALGLTTSSSLFLPGPEQPWWGYLLLVAGGFFLVGVGSLGFLEARRFRLVLTDDRMRLTTAWRHFDLPKEDIGAIRQASAHGTLTIKLYDQSLRKFASLNTCFEVDEYLVSWFDELRSLDKEEVQTALDRVLNDESLGEDEVSRRATGDRVLRAGRWFQGAVFGLVLWAIFKPVPYMLVLGAVAALVPLSLFAFWRFGSLLNLDDTQHSPVESLQAGLLLPSIVFVVRAMQDTHAVVWSVVVVPSAAIALAFGYLLNRLQPRAKWYTILSITALSFGYPAGLSLIVNERFDSSPPDTYKVMVMEKRIHKGKQTERYLSVSAAGPWKESHELRVGRKVFGEARQGENLRLHVHPGSLGILWWSLRRD